MVHSGRPTSLVNGYAEDGGHGDVISDDVIADDDNDVTYRPVDFCIPVGPIFNFITGQ